MYEIDQTHDPHLQSCVASANQPDTDFPLQNLPFCVFQESGQLPTIGVGIGDQILDLRLAAQQGWLDESFREPLSASSLNGVMALSANQRTALRHRLSHLLSESSNVAPEVLKTALHSQSDVTYLVPATIRDYTDFYASVFHATNVGSMFRPDNPLLPNYKHVPIGYHGRASSIVVSGTDIRRPVGQKAPAMEGGRPSRSPSNLFDYELEVGVFVAQGNRLGETIPIGHAEDHLFGMCLVNDWSARDIQKWEYQPLGPFLAKSFATSISPWVVTMQALTPFRCPAFLPSGRRSATHGLPDESGEQGTWQRGYPPGGLFAKPENAGRRNAPRCD